MAWTRSSLFKRAQSNKIGLSRVWTWLHTPNNLMHLHHQHQSTMFDSTHSNQQNITKETDVLLPVSRISTGWHNCSAHYRFFNSYILKKKLFAVICKSRSSACSFSYYYQWQMPLSCSKNSSGHRQPLNTSQEKEWRLFCWGIGSSFHRKRSKAEPWESDRTHKRLSPTPGSPEQFGVQPKSQPQLSQPSLSILLACIFICLLIYLLEKNVSGLPDSLTVDCPWEWVGLQAFSWRLHSWSDVGLFVCLFVYNSFMVTPCSLQK